MGLVFGGRLLAGALVGSALGSAARAHFEPIERSPDEAEKRAKERRRDYPRPALAPIARHKRARRS